MSGLTEVLLVVFLIFAGSAGLLVLVQRLAKKPLPVGCTPVDGECCLESESTRVCAAELQRRQEVHDAGA